MKITIDVDGKETVYDQVSDYYLAVKTMVPVANKKGGDMALLPLIRSYSVGDPRELIKEITQSAVELQDLLRSLPKKKRGTP